MSLDAFFLVLEAILAQMVVQSWLKFTIMNQFIHLHNFYNTLLLYFTK